MDGLGQGELDFIVYGVARSGTTALTRYLNAVDGITCGPEYFGIGHDHRSIRTPGDFIGDRFKKNPYGLKIMAESLARNTGGPVLYGNKLPNYFYRLDAILPAIRGTRAILCYRHPEACARSFNARAGRAADPWTAGRVGLFAPFDLIACLTASLRQVAHTDILVVPEAALKSDGRRVLDDVVAFLDPKGNSKGADVGVLNDLDRTRQNALGRAPGPLSPQEEAVLQTLPFEALHEALSRQGSYRLAEVAEDIEHVLDGIHRPLPQMIADLVAQDGRPEVTTFHERWVPPFERCLAPGG